MKVELSPAERRLAERLYEARPRDRAAIDACIDRTIAARGRGADCELGDELVLAALVTRVELAQLLEAPGATADPPRPQPPRRGSGRRAAGGAISAGRPALPAGADGPAPRRPSRRSEPPLPVTETPALSRPRTSQRLAARDPLETETGVFGTAELRRQLPGRGFPRGLVPLVAVALLLGSAIGWRVRRASPPPAVVPSIPANPDPPGEETLASAPAPLTSAEDATAAPDAAESEEVLASAAHDARFYEERGDYAQALRVLRELAPALRARVGGEETRLAALEAYRVEVDAAIDAADATRARGKDTGPGRARLVKLLEDPRRTSAIGRRLQAKLLEIDEPGHEDAPPEVAPMPPQRPEAPKPDEKAAGAASEALARAKAHLAEVESRLAAARAEHEAELANEGSRARAASEKSPLRVVMGSLVLEDAVVVEYGTDGFTLEAQHPVKIREALRWASVKPELAYEVRRLAGADTARERFLLARFCLENHLFDEARRAFVRVKELDPKLGARLPDVDALERAARVFRGRFTRTGVDEVSVHYDFQKAAQGEDLEDATRGTVAGGVLETQGSSTFLAAFKEAAFTGKVEVEASIARSRGASVAVGIHLEPRTALSAEYLVVLRRDKGDVVLYERTPQGTRELERKNGVAPGGTKIGLAISNGQARVKVDGKPLLRGAVSPGFTRACVVLGGVSRTKGAVSFDSLEVRGRVRAEWLRKSFEEVDALLRGALAGLDDLPVFDRPDGPPVVPPLSHDDAIEDAQASADAQAGRLKLAAGTPLDLASAADSFTRAIERSPDSASLRYYRALALEQLGKPRPALADVKDALARAPGFPEALALRARCLAVLGSPGRALEAAEAAVDLAPDLALAHAARAQAHFHAGDLEKALADLDLALALDPSNDEVRGFRRNVKHVLEGPPWERRFSKTTEHFVVETDISQKKCELYASHLEAIRAFYAARFPHEGDSPRARVLVFDTAEGFHRYAELTTDDRVDSLLGYYHPRYRQLLLYEDKDDASGEETLRVLYHESFHQYIHGVIPELPFWVNEGLAEFFSTCTIDERSDVKNEGLLLPARLADLKAFVRTGAGPVSFTRIMNETPHEFYQGPVAQKYAQAWSMVAFFKKGDGRFGPVLEAYLAALAKGETPRDAFRETWGKEDMTVVEEQWRSWVERMFPR
jgi:tetratricopeptide (TPR) repeat protein